MQLIPENVINSSSCHSALTLPIILTYHEEVQSASAYDEGAFSSPHVDENLWSAFGSTTLDDHVLSTR